MNPSGLFRTFSTAVLASFPILFLQTDAATPPTENTGAIAYSRLDGMPLIPPDPRIDYKIRILRPDSTVDYKIQVLPHASPDRRGHPVPRNPGVPPKPLPLPYKIQSR